MGKAWQTRLARYTRKEQIMREVDERLIFHANKYLMNLLGESSYDDVSLSNRLN